MTLHIWNHNCSALKLGIKSVNDKFLTVLSNCSRFGGVHGSPLSGKAGHCPPVWVEVVRHSQRVWEVPRKEGLLWGPGEQTHPQHWPLQNKFLFLKNEIEYSKAIKNNIKKKFFETWNWASLNSHIRKMTKRSSTEPCYWTLTTPLSKITPPPTPPPPPKKTPKNTGTKLLAKHSKLKLKPIQTIHVICVIDKLGSTYIPILLSDFWVEN